MRNAMAETSLDAFHSFAPIELQRKEKELLGVFILNPSAVLTRERLAAVLGWKEASVCGRASSLVAKNVLEEIDGGKTSSGRSAKLLRLPVKGQTDMFGGVH